MKIDQCQPVNRQIHNSPIIRISVPPQFNWSKSEVPFLEGREAVRKVFFLWAENTDYLVPPHQLGFPTGQTQQPSAGQAG